MDVPRISQRGSIAFDRMQRYRRPAFLLAIALVFVAGACSDADVTPSTAPTTSATTATSTTTAGQSTTSPPTTSPPTTVQTTTTTDVVRTALITSLPDGGCTGLGAPPDFEDAEVTFQVGRRLYAATPDGGNVRCLLEIPEDEVSVLLPPRLEWGGAADRLIVGDHAYLASGEVPTDVATFTRLRWTKPTGTSVLAVEEGRLLKRSVETGAVSDVTFLARHDLAVYHPAGTEILSVGQDTTGDYGIYLASNRGTNVRQLVDGTGAIVTELALLHDGRTLYFIAVHDGLTHLHELILTPPNVPPDGPSPEDGALQLHETSAELRGLELSPWDLWWAANQACGVDEDPGIVLREVLSLPAELEGVPAEAVGWLPADRLAVVTFPEACGLPGDLWIVDFGFVSGSSPTATLLYSGSEEAAATGLGIQAVGVANATTRSPAPEPPPPIGGIEFREPA